MEIDEEMEDELYNYIVGSNLEWSLIDQCPNEELKKKFMVWFQLD